MITIRVWTFPAPETTTTIWKEKSIWHFDNCQREWVWKSLCNSVILVSILWAKLTFIFRFLVVFTAVNCIYFHLSLYFCVFACHTLYAKISKKNHYLYAWSLKLLLAFHDIVWAGCKDIRSFNQKRKAGEIIMKSIIS